MKFHLGIIYHFKSHQVKVGANFRDEIDDIIIDSIRGLDTAHFLGSMEKNVIFCIDE